MKNIAENLKREKKIQIFELGPVFLAGEYSLPREKNVLIGALVFDNKSSKSEKMIYFCFQLNFDPSKTQSD